MKKIMWLIACVSLAGTAIVLPFMPDRVPMHFDMAGSIDRWGSKYECLVFPGVILLLTLVMSLLMTHYEKKTLQTADEKERAAAKTNVGVIGVTGVSMAALFTAMQGFILYGAYRGAVTDTTEQAVDIGKISVILMGVLFIVLGNYLPKTRRNSVVGFRIGWSMYNDNSWRKSNRFGAFALMVAGILTILLAVFVKNSFTAAMASLGLVLLAAFTTVVYAHKVYIQEVSAEEGEK